MNSRKLLITLLAASLPLAAPASRQAVDEFGVGNWTGAAYYSTETQRFDYCAMLAVYENDVRVLFSWSETGLTLGLAHPAWELTVGERYPLILSVDDRWSDQATGEAGTRNLVRVPLGLDPAAVAAMKHGAALEVRRGKTVFRFRLTGSRAAIDRLRACYRAHAAGLDPFGSGTVAGGWTGGAPAAGIPGAQRLAPPNLSHEAFGQLVSIATGGRAHAAPAPDSLPFADYAFVYGEGEVFGLYWEEANAGRSGRAILRGVISFLRDGCPGEFGSGDSKALALDSVTLRRRVAYCSGFDEGPMYSTVAVVDFGAFSQVFVTFGALESREVVERVGDVILMAEIKALDGS